ncbi:fumarylacetoacetase [Amphritea opalescens]|uniref:fumarylacetoacetase n=1 Tax=Amphritea opalescens TaxID=2490544 RepID=A0A430KW84_9GAMM|nr:fumarylacetoacetase [Amphritea opalescens]RTE67726.1 fumarylacetoacetase [Amphritea opalescens]
MPVLNETHHSDLRSWVSSANDADTDFPIQNLPFAAFRRKGSDEAFRGGVAIGDQVLDLAAVDGVFSGDAAVGVAACAQPTLNHFMSLGSTIWSALRLALSRALREGAAEQGALESCLVAQSDVEYSLPCNIGDYTDFYTSVFHATRIGSLFRPDNPLLPNYKWVPIGYHGRSSSIDVSGQTFRRPQGQTKAPDAESPSLNACQRLDYELEVGIYIGKGNELGEPVALDEADQHVFGYCLFNDWSARDIQAWEYQPLGPFLAKNFASTVSPWIVTNEALLPYRREFKRDAQDPQPLPYLASAKNSEEGALDIKLEVLLQTQQMREQGEAAAQLSNSNFVYSYWTVAQMVAHHTVNGCNLRPGDFFGSGTQSGPEHEQGGSLLELSRGGKEAISLPNGEQRTFLEDGDTVVMRGYCQQQGSVRIGFGEVASTVLPAKG